MAKVASLPLCRHGEGGVRTIWSPICAVIWYLGLGDTGSMSGSGVCGIGSDSSQRRQASVPRIGGVFGVAGSHGHRGVAIGNPIAIGGDAGELEGSPICGETGRLFIGEIGEIGGE